MKRYNKAGFSLIELMVVMAIAVFIMTGTIATYRFLDRSFTRAELSFFKIFCQKVRADAIASGITQTIEIDPATNWYHANGMQVSLPAQVNFGVAPGTLGPPSAPEKSITNPVTFKDNRIRCYPDGRVSSGIVYFTNKERSISYAFSNGVASLSYLRLYRYDQRKWVFIE